MSEFKIQGKIVQIYETQTIGASSFRKREFVLMYAENPTYPEYIKLEVVQDKCDMMNDFNVGQDVDVNYNLKGRKWTNPQGEEVYFNTIQAWRVVTSVQPHDITPQHTPSTETLEQPEWLNQDNSDGDGDLPF